MAVATATVLGCNPNADTAVPGDGTKASDDAIEDVDADADAEDADADADADAEDAADEAEPASDGASTDEEASEAGE